MSLANPTINAPRLRSPHRRHLHSRSASRSPTRNRARDFDPLLRDLSPTQTLRAFAGRPDPRQTDHLSKSIENAAHSERTLGAKAAQACADFRQWSRELASWEWPGTFESFEQQDGQELWGSLPAQTVRAYERRLEEIREDLDEVDVEELKDFVLSAHSQAGTAPASSDDSIGMIAAATDFRQLDDFTALITATILQALPYLSRLLRQLNTWSLRLSIFRATPAYLFDLKQVRADLDHGWAVLSDQARGDPQDTAFSRSTMEQMKQTISAQIFSLGRRLDKFLDELEGREETVPEGWIDQFEQVETQYGEWVVLAEKKAWEQEWNDMRDRLGNSRTPSMPDVSQSDESGDAAETVAPAETTGAAEAPKVPEGERNGTPSKHSRKRFSRSSSHSQIISSPRRGPFSPKKKSGTSSSTAQEATSQHDTEIPPASQTKSSAPADSAFDLPPQSNVKKRAAMLKADLEKKETLNRTRGPPVVRPFEHASNAFTKLFNRREAASKAPTEGPREERRSRRSFSRSGSRNGSKSKSRSKEGESVIWGGRGKSISDEPLERGREENVPPMPQSAKLEPPSFPKAKPEIYRPKGGAPETYQPTGLQSPFHSPSKQSFETPEENNFPANWPLSAPDASNDAAPRSPPNDSAPASTVDDTVLQAAEDDEGERSSSPEITSPRVPMDSDAFERRFVQPPMDDFERDRTNDNDQGSLTPDDELPPPRQDEYVAGPALETTEREKTESEIEELASGDSFGNKSSNSPDSSAYSGSVGDARVMPLRPSSVPSAEPLEHKVCDQSPPQPTESLSRRETPKFVRRASFASIESFPRSELRRIDVPHSRGSSVSPFSPGGASRAASGAPRVALDRSGSAVSLSTPVSPTSPPELMYGFPSPPSGRARAVSSGGGKGSSMLSSPLVEPEERVSSRLEDMPESDSTASAPLNAAMAKRKKVAISKSKGGDVKDGSPAKPSEDRFDRHVSEVLNRVSAPIRFKSRPGAETPAPSGPQRPPSAITGPLARQAKKDLTLAPAEPSPKKPPPASFSSAASSAAPSMEVKEYHLTHAGREEPIKLFVRLVGEGERVMVRVGGGWADLADYLRQYAEHHGSRTVSEGGVEVVSANRAAGTAPAVAANGAKRAFSGPMGDVNSSSQLKPRPGRAGAPLPDRPQTSLAVSTPAPHAVAGAESTTDDTSPNGLLAPPGSYLNPNHHTPTAGTEAFTTPKSSSRPSTADSASGTNTTSLSGPRPTSSRSAQSKNGEMDAHKARWVEGMLERAKASASAEKEREKGGGGEGERGRDGRERDGEGGGFGDLGRVGGTRRLVFRKGGK